jgi:hypothetical protein
MTVDQKLAKRDILWAGVDDWTGLWEVVWDIQTKWPELAGHPAEEMARSLLRGLLAQGLVYLCYFKHEGNSERPVGTEEAYELMENEENWLPVADREHVRFATTEAGEKEMHRLEKQLFKPGASGKARR